MGRKLANKQSKELLEESVIREKSLNKAEFSASWQGRVAILSEDSFIGEKIGQKKVGEYAIKVR